MRTILGFMILGLLLAPAVHAGDGTVAGTVALSAVSSTWFAVDAPLSGDDNANGYSLFEIGPSAAGPFGTSATGWGAIPGTSEWRTEVFNRGLISPGTTYFVRVTYVDPDGVTGPSPQVLGPIETLAFAPAAVTLGTPAAEARDTEIHVSLPISDDGNGNSFGTVEVATGPSGPWTRKCGSPSEANLPYQPKQCRVRSLTPGTDYWIRITVFDPDGVMGENPQVLGPIRYEGLQNLALGRPITADPGWGCCPSPSHLVDGRIQNDAWYYGFAWTGGTSHYAGGPDGFKQATVDLGSPTPFSRAVVWYHDPGNVPQVWKLQSSDDGVSWTDVYVQTQPVCRTATLALPGAWYYPACAHDATFPTVTARYFRYAFDDRTLFGGIHGWAAEIELFDAPPANQPPVADAGEDQQAAAGAGCTAAVTLDGTGSSDPDGDVLTYAWTGPFGTASGPAPTVSLPPGTHAVTLTVDDGNGGTATDEVTVTVRDVTPPVFAGVVATPGVLWPPNHKMKGVMVSLSATDACDAMTPVCRLVSIASNEPVNGLGDGDTAPDWQIAGDLSALLRAERSGNGNGRVYTLAVTCRDTVGNSAQGSATVRVPHDAPQ